MLDCPCCSDILLRHARSGQSYYLCRRCRFEIPEVTEGEKAGLQQPKTEALPLRMAISQAGTNPIPLVKS